MIKRVITPHFFCVKTNDHIGGTLKTEVYKQDTGLFKAFSWYAQDKEERIVGYGDSDNENIAIKLSRAHLRELWKQEQLNVGSE